MIRKSLAQNLLEFNSYQKRKHVANNCNMLLDQFEPNVRITFPSTIYD